MVIRMLCALVAAVVLIAVVACGGGSTPGTAARGGQTKVGLLLPGSTSDGGWNQMAADALGKLAASENLEIGVRQSVSRDHAADAIRQFDNQGFAVVIAHGYEYLKAVQEVTDPKGSPVKVKVVMSGCDVDSPHFQSILYDLAGPSYQLGVVAAKVSKTGKLGFIGGEEVPTVSAMERGFQAGAKSVNPNATFSVAWPGWTDPTKSKSQTEAFINQGIDVIMQNVDAASRGVFEAVKERNSKASDKSGPLVYTFGANSDQNANPICSDYTLASAVIKLEPAFARSIKQVKEGKFKGGVVREGLESGVGITVLNPKLVGKVINAETQKLVDEAGKKLTSGEVKIPKQ
jgi:basic membrane lipoprotein Med (substrate-binding protein (PBP1-ABC) superfamily)